MYSKNRRRNPEAGIALIAVLWALLLLSSLAATVEYIARTNAILRHRSLELARAEAAADAVIGDVIRRLSLDQPNDRPAIDGRSYTVDYKGLPTTVTISNEAGRIDLNTGDTDLISAFLQSQGLTEDRSTALLKDLRSFQRFVPGFPQSRHLLAVNELGSIPSWNTPELPCWYDSLTVYSGLSGVLQKDALPSVSAALKWANVHRLGGKEWVTPASTPLDTTVENSALDKVIRIIVTARLDAQSTSVEWIGRITGDASKPTLTMLWHRVPPRSCHA